MNFRKLNNHILKSSKFYQLKILGAKTRGRDIGEEFLPICSNNSIRLQSFAVVILNIRVSGFHNGNILLRRNS